MEENGLVRHHGGNLTFLGLWKLRCKYKYNSIGVPLNHKNQYDILRAQIIRFNLTAQAYRMRKSEIHLRNGFVPKKKTEKISSNYVGLSSQGVGKLFGLSKASGSRIRQKLSKLNVLKTERQFSVLYKNVDRVHFTAMRNNFIIPQYSFLRSGRVVVELRNRIEYIGGTIVRT